MTVMVTGGAGFIGSNFVIDWLANNDESVVNLDILNYAGNLANLSSLENDGRHIFIKGDIGDVNQVSGLLAEHRPRAVINFAAETHIAGRFTDSHQRQGNIFLSINCHSFYSFFSIRACNFL